MTSPTAGPAVPDTLLAAIAPVRRLEQGMENARVLCKHLLQRDVQANARIDLTMEACDLLLKRADVLERAARGERWVVLALACCVLGQNLVLAWLVLA